MCSGREGVVARELAQRVKDGQCDETVAEFVRETCEFDGDHSQATQILKRAGRADLAAKLRAARWPGQL